MYKKMKHLIFLFSIILCFNVNALTKTIGATGNYISITAAWAAISGIQNPITEAWIFEIKSDYNIASETFPINLTAINGASLINTLTIRPQLGVTGINITNAISASTLILNGADYVIIDGRPGSVGTSELTIENTQTATTKHAISLTADASNCTIQYCTVKGSSFQSTQLSIASVISIDEGNATTNCDNTTITNCTITKSGVNKPSTLISVARNTATITLDNLNISNNNLVDFDNAGIYSPWPIASLSITNNNFYQTATWGDLSAAAYGIYISNASNGSLTITGNYIGGQAINCGGSAMAITSSTNGYNFTAIKTSSYTTTATVSNNTIQNITLTQATAGNSTNGITCIDISGSSNYTVGSSGNGNVIGATTGTGAITVAGAIQACFIGITNSGTGNDNISYNSIGAITISATSGTFTGIVNSSTGTKTVSNNTIGSTVANNITVSSDATTTAFSFTGTGTYTSSSNTIQQFNLTGGGASTTFIGIYIFANSTSDITSNTIQNISCNGTGTHIIIKVNSTGICSVNSNTIGSTTNDNISFSGNSSLTPIFFSAAGTFTCNNNTIQEINHSGGGSSTTLLVIKLSAGTFTTCTGNTIKNIVSNGTGSGTSGLVTISVNSNNNHSVTSNTIQDIVASNQFYGIYISSTGTMTVNSNIIGASTANNIDLSYNGIHYGIYFTLSAGTYTCNSNTIQQFRIAAGANAAFQGIVATAGTISASSNLITNITSAGTTSSATTATIGIFTSANTNHSITTNTISLMNISGMFNAIYSSSNGTVTISNNTIGNTTNSNITLSGNYGPSTGIATANGTYTLTSNKIQNFACTNTGSSNSFIGIYIISGTSSLTSNTITTISSATSKASTSGGILGSNGICAATGGNTITQNKVLELTNTNSAAGAYGITGIYSSGGSGTNLITRNKITNLASAGNTASTIVAGLFFEGAGNVNAYNNVVLLNNASTAGAYSGNSIVLNGLRNSSTGTVQIYHNTIKVFGTATTLSGSSSAYRNGGANTIDLRNNIFQNIRLNSGGTGKHYTMNYSTTPTTVTAEDYNYFEASANASGGYLGVYGGVDKTNFAAWQGVSPSANSKNSSITIGSSGNVPAATTSDIKQTGTNAINASVNIDYDNSGRSNLGSGAPNGPWMGAFEAVTALPIQLISFTGKAEDQVNIIKWTTASEFNNDYFMIEKITDENNFKSIGVINGAGTSKKIINYIFYDYNVEKTINYYRLKQIDFDGKHTLSQEISIDNRENVTSIKSIDSITNILGQEVNEYFKGLVIIHYSDGSSIKIIK